MKKTFWIIFTLSIGIVASAQELVSSTPAQGSLVHELPSKVQLVMNQNIDLSRSNFSVYLINSLDADAITAAQFLFEDKVAFDLWVDTGVIEQESQGKTITLGLLDNLPAGIYVVEWWTHATTGSNKGFTYFSYQPQGDTHAMQQSTEHHDETKVDEDHMHHGEAEMAEMSEDHMHHDEAKMDEDHMEHHDEAHSMEPVEHLGEAEHIQPSEHHEEAIMPAEGHMEHSEHGHLHSDAHGDIHSNMHAQVKTEDHHSSGEIHGDTHDHMHPQAATAKDRHSSAMEDVHRESTEPPHLNEISAASANAFRVGERVIVLEPLLDISGLFKIALRAEESAYIQLSVTSPSGVEKLITIESNTAVFELGPFEEGVWKVLATVGEEGDWLETTILAQKQKSDFDSEVILFLTPVPNLAYGGRTEAFVYGFGDGDNLHKRFVLERNMQGVHTSLDGINVDLPHNHFMDMYNDEDFTPMTNNASIDFSLPGLWNIVVTIIGGFSETATFQIEVDNQ